MTFEYKSVREVEFAETDMAGIMHFANYFRWMEATEHAFMRSLGFIVHREDRDGMEGWPRVDARCSYSGPLRYGDRVEVHLLVRTVSQRSLVLEFIFRRLGDDGGGEAVARGTLTVVHVQRGAGDERMRATAIDEALRAKLSEAPSHLLEENA